MKRFVLVVDDDPGVIGLVSERLELMGFATTSAEDAMQAFIQAEAVNPILMVLDMNMPGFGSGADAVKAMRSNPKTQNVPIIILTGMDLRKAQAMLPPDPRMRLAGKPPDWKLIAQHIKDLTGIAVNMPG